MRTLIWILLAILWGCASVPETPEQQNERAAFWKSSAGNCWTRWGTLKK